VTPVPSHNPWEMPPLGCHLHDWNIAARASAGYTGAPTDDPAGSKGTRPTDSAGSKGTPMDSAGSRGTPTGPAGSRGTRPTGAGLSVGSRAFRYGLIVDLDDTLYDREQFVHSGLMAVARHVQEHRAVSAMDAFAAMTVARRNGAAGRELQALCARFGWADDEVPPLVDVFREHRPVLRLPGETVRALSQVRADGWRIVVLTNGLPCVQRGKVSALGLGAFVDAVVYADEHAPGGKPARAAFRAALATLSLPADRCVCVGDDPARDIAGAQAMGIRTVWVNAGLEAPSSGLEPDAQIASIGDLPLVLAELMEMVKSDAA